MANKETPKRVWWRLVGDDVMSDDIVAVVTLL